MRNYFTFGGIDSRNYGVYLSGDGIFSVPAREYEFVPIPGKTGDLVLGGKRLENFELTYQCFIAPVGGSCGNYSNYKEAFFALRNALLSVNGYAQLADSYTAGRYYEAVYVGDMTADSTTKLDAGEFELTFNCNPLRFFTDTTTVAFTAGGSVDIPTDGHRGFPIITTLGTGNISLFRTGVVAVQDQVFVTQNFANGLVIDSKLMDCYSVDDNSVTANKYVRFLKYRFPQFNPVGEAISTKYVLNSTGLSGTVVVRWYDL